MFSFWNLVNADRWFRFQVSQGVTHLKVMTDSCVPWVVEVKDIFIFAGEVACEPSPWVSVDPKGSLFLGGEGKRIDHTSSRHLGWRKFPICSWLIRRLNSLRGPVFSLLASSGLIDDVKKTTSATCSDSSKLSANLRSLRFLQEVEFKNPSWDQVKVTFLCYKH